METILILKIYDCLATKFGSEIAENIIRFIDCKIKLEVEQQVQQVKQEELRELRKQKVKKAEANFKKLELATWIFYYLSVLFFFIMCLTS
jgi:hypothetical protein